MVPHFSRMSVSKWTAAFTHFLQETKVPLGMNQINAVLESCREMGVLIGRYGSVSILIFNKAPKGTRRNIEAKMCSFSKYRGAENVSNLLFHSLICAFA